MAEQDRTELDRDRDPMDEDVVGRAEDEDEFEEEGDEETDEDEDAGEI
jgi:hypothetical protein